MIHQLNIPGYSHICPFILPNVPEMFSLLTTPNQNRIFQACKKNPVINTVCHAAQENGACANGLSILTETTKL